MVSVIVPMLNERAYIAKCLDSLVASDYPRSRLEVLVVDGGSTDGSRQIALDKASTEGIIRVLQNPRRITAAAMNIGLENSRGEVIVLMSAHAYVAADFLAESVFHLQTTDADCVGGPIESVSHSLWGKTIALAMSCAFGVGDALFRYADRRQYVDTVAFGAYWQSLFKNIGHFDENLAGNEDDEFNYRVRVRGGKILLVPSIRSYYHTRDSLPKLWKQWFRYGRGKVMVLRKYPSAAMIRQFVPATLVAALLVSGLLALVSPLALMALGTILVTYLTLSFLASTTIATRHGLRHLFLLPAAFGCIHFGYGFGFLFGLLRLPTGD